MLRAMAPPPAGLVVAGEEAAPATTARLRLARELHDSVASAIVVIGVQAGVAGQALDRGEGGRERAREALRTIRTVSRQVLEDLQATVAMLRGGSGADGPVRGVGQLDELTSLAADVGVRVGLTVQGVARRLPPPVDLAAYRIVQEALTNVLRHAGPATVTVRLSYEEDHLAVQVDDDGHGAAAGWPPPNGRQMLDEPVSGSGVDATAEPVHVTRVDPRTSAARAVAVPPRIGLEEEQPMTTLKTPEPSIVRTALGLLATVYAATFVVAVLLHVGADIPLGFAVLDEPRRPFAVIVEGVAGIVLAAGAFAVFAGTTRAWAAVTGAHAVALAGVLWGMVAVAAGRGPHTQLNDTYHRVMVVLLGTTLILLLTPLGRNSLGRERNRSPGPAAAPDPESR